MGIDQLINQLIAQAFNLDRAALRKMQNRLLALRTAKQAAGAAVIGFTLLAHGDAGAHGAHAGHGERWRLARPFFEQHRHHFRNHIARTANDHGVTHTNVFATRFVLVVQCGIGHRHAAHKHGGQLGDGCEFASAPDLNFNAQYGCQLLLCRVLVRDGPARLARDKAQLTLQIHAVDFVDDAIDVKPQAVTLLTNALMVRY